jgi:hypothetical protein
MHVVHHMGHAAERSRGDSRLLDWPDALWKIVRDKDDEDDTGMDDPQGSRYFSAYGRDVDVPNPSSSTTEPPAASRSAPRPASKPPGITKRNLRAAVRAHGVTHHPAIDEAVERLVEEGHITRQIKGQTHSHFPSDKTAQLDTVPNRAQTAPSTGVPSALKGLDTPVHTTPTVPAGTGTVPCPDCDHNQIPAHHARCAECADRLIRESEPE